MTKRVCWNWLASFLLVLLALAVACGSDGPNGAVEGDSGNAADSERVTVADGAYYQIAPQPLDAMLRSEGFPLVNVHVPYEGEIEGTDLFIPYDQIAQTLSDLPADKASKVVLYCRSGRMSAIAAATLVDEGYTNVWDLKGGMIAWEEAGYPLVRIEP